MRVIVPFTRITVPAVVEALNEYAPEAEAIDVSASRFAYWELLGNLWEDGEDFLIVEHDVEIHAKVLPALTRCRHTWCGYPYDAVGTPALGCTRFAAELLAEHPTAVEEAGKLSDGVVPQRDWRRLDTHLQQVLTDTYGLKVHRHLPPVTHHHVG